MSLDVPTYSRHTTGEDELPWLATDAAPQHLFSRDVNELQTHRKSSYQILRRTFRSTRKLCANAGKWSDKRLVNFERSSLIGGTQVLNSLASTNSGCKACLIHDGRHFSER